MKLYVGVTDDDWFEYLAHIRPDEVNFWRPRSQAQFRALSPGELLLFKLHSPRDFISGGGVFVRHTFLPIELAWHAFGDKNGAADLRTFRSRILQHRQPDEMGLQLGCTILVQPFFWPREEWIPVPKNWARNIVQGRGYDPSDEVGARLISAVRERLAKSDEPDLVEVARETSPRYGEPMLIRPRLGQGAFRVEVTDAYTRRCAVTGERTLPALEAAHIKPYAELGPHEICNGLLLRSDLHHLFDAGYLSITPERFVRVSRRIREEFENGRDYYALDGTRLKVLPESESDHPKAEYLEWHLAERFRS